jgi:organic hydroperoxide reductase OsmC/OhrA
MWDDPAMAVKAKELRYAVDLAVSGTYLDEAGTPLEVPDAWTPEHLLLAALLGCSLKSFRHHASRAGVAVSSASGSARTLVTRRESDGRYAMTETDVALALELEPRPGADVLSELLAKAERDCFVGASLEVAPSYRWTVDGEAARPGKWA